MKIRTSFVTNSSSSSFILAVKDGATLSDMKDALDVAVIRENFKDWFCYSDEEISDMLGDKTDDELATEIATDLISMRTDASMKLEGWNISAGEIYSDGIEEMLEYAAIYFGAIKNTDKVKLG